MEYKENAMNLQQFFPDNLRVEAVESTEDTIYIQMKSTTRSCVCPRCNKETRKYHAVHKRKVQDLPVFGKTTMLMLSLYEFSCDNPDCRCISVTENFDGFLNGYSRMTERLEELITHLALETSCEGAARILKFMKVKTSGDTVIRILEKRFEQQPQPSCCHCIGVDDFAFKKRHRYGTIIVDGETHDTVAVLDGRDGEALKEWLRNNRHVTAVTRDRASAYAKAIEEILPDAMQIADRFHLHQNLLEAVKKILARELPASTAVPADSQAAGMDAEKKDKKNIPCPGCADVQ